MHDDSVQEKDLMEIRLSAETRSRETRELETLQGFPQDRRAAFPVLISFTRRLIEGISSASALVTLHQFPHHQHRYFNIINFTPN